MCGTTCDVDPDCGAGLYCSTSRLCTADCADAVRCVGSAVCSPQGRCISSGIDGGPTILDAGPRPDVPPYDAPPEDGSCGSITLETTRAVPNVVVIVDRSGSMGEEEFPAGSGTSRWVALRDALIEPTIGLLPNLDHAVRFGFVTYRNLSAAGGACPQISVFPARLNNAEEIAGVYETMMPYGPTPTGDSITATLSRLSEIVSATDEPTVIVLATDGEPNTCEDATDSVGGRAESVAAVEAAFAMGVRTFVISVGSDVSTGHLQDVANAGLGRTAADPPAEFWVATGTTGLSSALNAIIGGVVSCDIQLVGEIDPTMACFGTVTLSGRELGCGDPDGWEVTDSTHIRLNGAACEELVTTGGTVRGAFPCEVVVF